MYVAKCEIKISAGEEILSFNRVVSVEINKSTHSLIDTAIIRLPMTAVMKNMKASTAVEVAQEIKVGMEVKIRLWYKGYEAAAVVFSGYVKRINQKTPVEIECEDIAGLLRYKNIVKDWKDTTLKKVLNEIVSDSPVKLSEAIPAVSLNVFYLKNISGLEALQKIRDEFGLSMYIDANDSLYCGLAYQENRGVVKYDLSGASANVIRTDNLRWQSKEDIQLCVKAIAVKDDNTCLIRQAGDANGALKVLRFHNIGTEDELQTLADQELLKLKFDGYRGKITGFLVPGVIPGMIAKISDEKYPKRQGHYFVESVRTSFGVNGCSNEVELGIKIDI